MLYVLRNVETNHFFVEISADGPIFDADTCYLFDTLEFAKTIKQELADKDIFVAICEVTIKP